MENIINITPNLIFTVDSELYCRGLEIDAYLKNHPEVEKYLIMDDMSDFLTHQYECFLMIDYKVGITDEDIEYCKYWFK